MAECHNEVTIVHSLDNLSEWIPARQTTETVAYLFEIITLLYPNDSLSSFEDIELFRSESHVMCQLSRESDDDFFVSMELFLDNDVAEPT